MAAVALPRAFKLDRVTVAGKRWYRSPAGILLPSVTSVLGVIGKPALVGWAAKEERLLVAGVAADLYHAGTLYENRDAYLAALNDAVGNQKAHQRMLKKAAEIGTQIHKACEATVLEALKLPFKFPKMGEEASLAYGIFLAWWDQVDFEPVASEVRVFSEELGIAGTLDFVAYLNVEGERKLMLGDYKSGKRIYDEAFLQNAAYQVSWEEMGGEPLDGGIILRLPKNITDPGFEVAIVPERSTLVPVFKSARTIFQWQWDSSHRDQLAEAELEYEEV